jgi:hypothetical protein
MVHPLLFPPATRALKLPECGREPNLIPATIYSTYSGRPQWSSLDPLSREC